VHEVIFANPGEDRRTVANLLAHLEEKPVSVRVVPDLMDLAFLRATASQVGSIPLIGLKQPVLDEYQRLAKRILDLAVVVPSLILSSPLMLVCAIWIRLDSTGPAIFRQERVGENGKLFEMYKFRTMFVGAENEQYKLVTHTEDAKLLFPKRADDPRITRVGRFLRRFSLDELPQLLNVLRGEMRLVGPPPELPALMRLYEAGQRKRLCVPPGLTGWWQINGRSDSTECSQSE
jgi:lipopolysaccharide/colanic/teichoic acid biosynthesis glycosyltransferase